MTAIGYHINCFLNYRRYKPSGVSPYVAGQVVSYKTSVWPRFALECFVPAEISTSYYAIDMQIKVILQQIYPNLHIDVEMLNPVVSKVSKVSKVRMQNETIVTQHTFKT